MPACSICWFLCKSQLLWTLCTQAIVAQAAAGRLMGPLHDACFSTACYLHNPLQLHLRLAQLALCKLLSSSLVLLHNTINSATPLPHQTAAADCGMATFEDPTLVQKLDANLGPEAAATAKKMKFLNFFVSLLQPGWGCGVGHCWVPHHTSF